MFEPSVIDRRDSHLGLSNIATASSLVLSEGEFKLLVFVLVKLLLRRFLFIPAMFKPLCNGVRGVFDGFVEEVGEYRDDGEACYGWSPGANARRLRSDKGTSRISHNSVDCECRKAPVG